MGVYDYVKPVFLCIFRLFQSSARLSREESQSQHVPPPESPPPGTRPTTSPPPPPPPLIKKESGSSGSENDSGSNTALKRLQECLKSSRVPSSIDKRQTFVPESSLLRLVIENLKEILREESIVDAERVEPTAQLISQRAVKLFAILVDIKKERHITQFLDEGIHDDNLPFMRPTMFKKSASTLLTKQGESMRTLKDWDSQSTYNFETKQYRVLSPIFRTGEHYELHTLDILPFIEPDTESNYKPFRAGGYGEVTQELIHPDHHAFGDPSERKELVVADKRMFHDTDFEPERTVYRALGKSKHPHVIDLLFTYRKGDRQRGGSICHLVFPWADGNLKDYWEKYPMPSLSPQFLLWWLKQMVGIASGLAFFHKFTDAKIGNPRYGRHGDIKAQNILWFEGLDVLKIADLGLASIRGIDSRSNVDPNTVTVSPTYSPPDVERRCQISRKWDIWSLGCLYVEAITHLLLGCEAIEQFSEQRLRDSEFPELRTDPFYSSDYESVRPAVFAWVDRLRRDSRCSTMMYDMLGLIMNEMIVIQPENRSSSKTIFRKLDRILNHACQDNDYLFAPYTGARSAPSELLHSFRSIKSNILQPSKPGRILKNSKSYSWNC
ncbi:kinase-like domain-containing protein [Aspergillus cavernicola]|uniref:Kinase-like domain-containing protein n=1 Tax=Aspergillus cavernicola TaxID=176166 RepID=A0ABR4I4X6_9EURO